MEIISLPICIIRSNLQWAWIRHIRDFSTVYVSNICMHDAVSHTLCSFFNQKILTHQRIFNIPVKPASGILINDWAAQTRRIGQCLETSCYTRHISSLVTSRWWPINICKWQWGHYFVNITGTYMEFVVYFVADSCRRWSNVMDIEKTMSHF